LTLPCFGLLGIATAGTNNADAGRNPTGREEAKLCFPTRSVCSRPSASPATRTDRRKQQDDEKNQRENSKATHTTIFVFVFVFFSFTFT
jgi:hypothetical protein